MNPPPQQLLWPTIFVRVETSISEKFRYIVRYNFAIIHKT